MLRAVTGGLLFGLLGSVAMPAAADYVTVISFGGANKAAQETAFYKPFKEATGNAVVHGSYNGDLDKLKRMVEVSHVSWDVVEVEAPELARGCQEGLFEKLDQRLIGDPADFVPGAVQPCGVGIFVWTTLLAYNQDKVQGKPASWADFWDVKKYPGKRGLRWGAKYSLEFALMADGVAAKDVYQVLGTQAGVDRAFHKLDELKPYIHWWKSGQDPVRDLADGTVVMSSAYNGRISAAQAEQKGFRVVWSGGIYDFDFWALPAGVWKKELAQRFVAFASQPAQQKVFAENIAYGPTNRKAVEQLAPEVAANLPTAPRNMANAVGMNVAFWAEHGDALEQRFQDWAKR
ncbi:ABC transporter substrate-binding protein [Pseudomonas panipatensis]|uniref:Putative spermidine/putrescine transport system substrate-binding protein n=1 Tax=Pseudomonas panipatensis TaxID=428992 RepID=A0A1G8JF11_9PSED|nr:ABC transporter substrate-binding protein [Pseudomonas panipatensis]SDI29874.1 putative spermidine/putrescine transport system substrate-binding protein [Pseudomonas panipatensis]SMP51224.1 putative spermidine/putrescine transport system substrate-binding protein [Pseudomonas panipatensis]